MATRLGLIVCVLLAACGDEGGADHGAAGAGALTTELGSAPWESAASDCAPDAVEDCECAPGVAGERICTGAGVFSACACMSVEATMEAGPVTLPPPPPPEPIACGGVDCPVIPQDTEFALKVCCTEDDRCGASVNFVFGEACVPLDLEEPIPEADATCPDEFPNFLDLIGCCTAEGQCGVYFEGLPTWHYGCIERTYTAALLNEGDEARNMLAARFFMPTEDAEFEAISCTP